MPARQDSGFATTGTGSQTGEPVVTGSAPSLGYPLTPAL